MKKLKVSRKFGLFIKTILGSCSLVSLLTTLAIISILVLESFSFFQEVSVLDFLIGTNWHPLFTPRSFGVMPLVAGTLLITIGSGLVAIPLGVNTAIYLSEYASERTRAILKPVLEVLVGIPTIVYGFFALTFVTPILQFILPQTEVFNALSGAIVVGIMILPMVCSLCDDAFTSVPSDLKMGGYALGATSFEVITKIIVPATLSRIFAAFVLALSRAIGETMAVTLAAGSSPNLSLNPLKGVQTMTAYIVQVSLGDIPANGIEYKTTYAVAALLFAMTLGMNIFGQVLMKRYSLGEQNAF